MKTTKILIAFLAGCVTIIVINGRHQDRQFEKGFESGSSHAEVGRLIFSQLRFVNDKKNYALGVEYIDAAIELATHHFCEAKNNLSKSTLTYAVDKCLPSYKEQMTGLVVTYSDQQKTMLGNYRGANFRVFRHRDLLCKFALGTPGEKVVDDIIRQIINKLPEKMNGGPIAE